MPDIINVTYSQTGNSLKTNEFGMREMQQNAYAKRDVSYLLIKAPPASGKSRALMFIALDKLHNQGLEKVIVAVPERSIGSSFAQTDLTSYGFFADWSPKPENNLCTPGGEGSKVEAFIRFLRNDGDILICTHATLRFAFEEIEEEKFNDTVLAIDEFHHVSADSENNRLGYLIKRVMNKSTAHVIAMTGSYFRGDSVPVLLPEDESRFTKVTYTYYQQLNEYEYLKSLGIGYHFYQGKYTSAIHEVLDSDKKTIIHIPSPNAGESTKDKYQEVDHIIDSIGTVECQDENTGILTVRRNDDGKIIKIADLVYDKLQERNKVISYLRNMDRPEDVDIIIALGMAKEGFDWPCCEHALTVGYRGSLTEIIQIIGRTTRDNRNKTHAQFTNLIAEPNANDEKVKESVNNMLKAITASLLMEQVLAPNFKFKAKSNSDDGSKSPGAIDVKGMKEPSSKKVKGIIENDMNDLKAAILQDELVIKSMTGNTEPEVINKVYIPKVIQKKYPGLSDKELEEVRQHVVTDSFLKSGRIKKSGDKRFIRMADKFINLDDLHIDLIDTVNPFQKAYEVLSKSVTAPVLKLIQESIDATRIKMTDEEAFILWPKIQEFFEAKQREPDKNAFDPRERRMAEALIYIRNKKREMPENG